jgi:hypothetical protein
MTDKPKCRDCVYWFEHKGDDIGECRVRGGTAIHLAQWPATDPDQWCGEWTDTPPPNWTPRAQWEKAGAERPTWLQPYGPDDVNGEVPPT